MTFSFHNLFSLGNSLLHRLFVNASSESRTSPKVIAAGTPARVTEIIKGYPLRGESISIVKYKLVIQG